MRNTLRNISIIRRVGASFLLLSLFLVFSVIQSFISNSEFSRQLHTVSDQGAPLLLEIGQTSQALSRADLSFRQAMNAGADIDGVKANFDSLFQDYQAKTSELGNTKADIKDFSATVARIENLNQNYLDAVDTLINQKKLLQTDIQKQRQDLTRLNVVLPQIKKNLSDSVYEADDEYIRFAADSFTNTMAVAEINLLDGLNLSDSAQIQEVVARNLKQLKRFESALSDLNDELPNFVTSNKVELKRFSDDAFEASGVLQRHLKNQQRNESIALDEDKNEALVAQISENFVNLNLAAVDLINQSTEQTQAALEMSQNRLLLLLAIALPLCLLVGIGIAKTIRKPLHQLLSVIKAAAQGDMRKRVEYVNDNEFGQLGSAINQMLEQMDQVLAKVTDSSKALHNSIDSAATTVNHSKDSLGRQREDTSSVATAVTQMEQSVREVAQNAAHSLEQVRDVENASQTGRTIMSDNISTTHRLAEKLQSSSEVIDSVGEMSQNIGSILDVIRGIADQTNLLALNAAIEAARAGEQGRGFAVVADEVRVLAQKTTTSTSEIQTMIENLQNGAKKAVVEIADCSTEMDTSLHQASDANGAMEEIQGIVTLISDMSTQIAAAAEQQQSTVSEISRNIIQISDVSQANYQELDEVSALTTELSNLAGKQDELVGQFQLSKT
ncbi:methyl-accepting chemotaxis protein [Alginatibacterium sediminis]|uniref:Methyl-accepting chemotaxis protein n=1 Tax=Alginatibacterium sediminis TaxID=2164068 RepID=A0A420EFV0_9ALTE|nr:methyl-accepting chemotaxis protein [Alginatibacterium sediminis]RKF19534.1 methyl-accepting chemotaxis protein [Alginatibacterium sediminis]